MRQATVTQVGAGVSAVIPLDYLQVPFNVGVDVDVTGTVNYTIQVTFDDVFASGFDPATAVWYSIDIAAMVAATADQMGRTETPCRGMRINQASGSGSTRLRVTQGIGG